MSHDLMHPADQLVSLMHRIYTGRLTTTSGGNLSIREPGGDVWITPAGIDKGSLHRSDIVCLKEDGRQVGHQKPSSELHFHRAIYAARSDIRAILHAHSAALMAFSMLREIPSLHLMPLSRIVCGTVGLSDYAPMGSKALAEALAAQFRRGHTAVLMENHGVCVGAASQAEAYRIFETLERTARIELFARRLGTPQILTEAQIDLARTQDHIQFGAMHKRPRPSSEELALRRDIVRLIQRGVEQELFCSSQGTISARLSDGTFLITPNGIDRRLIREGDLVWIRKSLREPGKIPSRAVFLHELIYRRQAGVRAIIAAQPPHVMPFTMTAAQIEPRLMPESQILLGTLPTLPYGQNYENPQQACTKIGPQQPAVLLDHDGILTVGSSLIEAFDRIEVAEFTARAQLAVPDPKKLYRLNEAQLAKLPQESKTKEGTHA